MTPQAFAEFLENFKEFMREESLGRLQFLKYVLGASMKMTEEQSIIFIQTIAEIEYRKAPADTKEFDRIMKGFGK